jgi:saccharopine dehydrogenase-like NADP-dependent oxidoreductase
MKRSQILILGAGKSATVLIQYLQQKAVENNWYIVLADGDKNLSEKKWNNATNGHAIGFDIEDNSIRNSYIQDADVVVSMLPAFLHFIVAKDCLQQNKPLFTASYVDDNMQKLKADLKAKNLLFLCEMGLDPGIDHMSAMELIHRIQNKGGVITSFKSHCGGLIAPESDDNPWHYKISWNPRNIILAGKAGAIYLEDGVTKELPYEKLFEHAPFIQVLGIGQLSYYPNRNSLSYIDTYALHGVHDFVRTTLRQPAFCRGWNAIVQLKLTNENELQLAANETVHGWFQKHLLDNNLQEVYAAMLLDEQLREQLLYIGLEDTIHIPQQYRTNAAILQWLLESKWKLDTADKDMVVMVHELTYTLNHTTHHIKSSMVIKGQDAELTAMAKTVGLPLAMGVCAYLKGEIQLTGLHIPTHPSIYTPILKSLAEEGIHFDEIES